MLSYDEMPEDSAEVAKVEINFPHVDFSEVSAPSEIEPHLLGYLKIEGFFS